ncbi:MAG: hypothetical protein AAFQ52_05590 [Chloroflexota bacterium]
MHGKQKRNPYNKMLRTLFLRFFIFGIVIVALVGGATWVWHTLPAEDYVLYTHATTGELHLYNPRTQTDRIILDETPQYFYPSGNGRIAYIESYGETNDIFVLDVLDPQATPINVTNSPNTFEHFKGWNPQGTHIVFLSGETRTAHAMLTIWDGESFTDVTYGKFFEVEWNRTGDSLAFSVDMTPYEYRSVYVWQNNTLSLVTHPEIPNARSNNPKIFWGPDNKLAISYADSNLPYIYAIGYPHKTFIWQNENVTYLENPNGADSIEALGWTDNDHLILIRSFERGDVHTHSVTVWSGETFGDNLPFYHRIAFTTDPESLQFTSSGDIIYAQTFENGTSYLYVWDGYQSTHIGDIPALYRELLSGNSQGYVAYIGREQHPSTITSTHLHILHDEQEIDIELRYQNYALALPNWSSGNYLSYEDDATPSDATLYIWHPSGTQTLDDVYTYWWLFGENQP